jgi:spoIIIJ-associated protein
MEKYVFSGKTEEEALEEALKELSVEKKDILYETEEQKGGLFKGKKYEVTVTKKSDINDFIKESVLKIVTDMGFDAKIESKIRDDILNLTIYSDNNNLLIGRNGKNMSALSVVIKQLVQNEIGAFYKFNLDVGEYKVKQQKNLERMAKRVAREVAKSKIEVKLDPMNSYERRIIHNILNDDRYVYTESTGEEPNRCVVIKVRND